MNKEIPVIVITPPTIKMVEKNHMEIIKYNYETSHLIYEGKDLGTMEELSQLHQKYQKLKEQVQQRDEVIDEAIDMLNLIIPELWNINNNMTYKLQDVRRILTKYKGDEK